MAIKAVSQLPDPIQPLADTDLLFLTQYDADSEQFVSVQLPLGQLKDWLNTPPVDNLFWGLRVFFGEDDNIYFVRSDSTEWTLNRVTVAGIESTTVGAQTSISIGANKSLLTVLNSPIVDSGSLNTYELGGALSGLSPVTYPAFDTSKTFQNFFQTEDGQYSFVCLSSPIQWQRLTLNPGGTAYGSATVTLDFEDIVIFEGKISPDGTKAALLFGVKVGGGFTETYNIGFYSLADGVFTEIAREQISPGQNGGISTTNAIITWVSNDQVLTVFGDNTSPINHQTFLKSIKLMPDDSISILNVDSTIPAQATDLGIVIHASSDGSLIVVSNEGGGYNLCRIFEYDVVNRVVTYEYFIPEPLDSICYSDVNPTGTKAIFSINGETGLMVFDVDRDNKTVNFVGTGA